MSVLDAFSLSGKVSVVTGANRGIGRALVTALAEAGSDVVLLVRDTGGSAGVVKELDALGVTRLAPARNVYRPDEQTVTVELRRGDEVIHHADLPLLAGPNEYGVLRSLTGLVLQ